MECPPGKFKEIDDPEFVSDQVGMSAVKIQDLQARRVMNYDFDLKRMTSFEGDTGAYLQYAHVRLCSVARKVAPGIVLRKDISRINVSLLTEPKVQEIIMLMATYPDVVRSALKLYEASTVVTFCFKLCHLISSVWETVIVKGQEQELAQARLLLYTAARIVLGNAFTLLSIKPLDRM